MKYKLTKQIVQVNYSFENNIWKNVIEKHFCDKVWIQLYRQLAILQFTRDLFQNRPQYQIILPSDDLLSTP